MQIKLYSILHNDIDGWYTLDSEDVEINENNALDVLIQAKERFKIAGKTFIMMTDKDTFFITRTNKKLAVNEQAVISNVNKKWKAYTLQKGVVEDDEDVTER